MGPEIAAGITAALNTSKLLGSLLEVTVDMKAREKIIEAQTAVIELQSKLMDVQAQHAEVLKSKDEILAKLEAYENWDATAANYELKRLATGSLVQALKATSQTGEIPHYACPKCFQEHKKFG